MHHIDVRMEKDVYDVNNAIADGNARHLKEHGIRAFDLLGAIGSGRLHSSSASSLCSRQKGSGPAQLPVTCTATTISGGS